MRIVARRPKGACRVVLIKSGVHSLGDKGYVRFCHKADMAMALADVRYWG